MLLSLRIYSRCIRQIASSHLWRQHMLLFNWCRPNEAYLVGYIHHKQSISWTIAIVTRSLVPQSTTLMSTSTAASNSGYFSHSLFPAVDLICLWNVFPAFKTFTVHCHTFHRASLWPVRNSWLLKGGGDAWLANGSVSRTWWQHSPSVLPLTDVLWIRFCHLKPQQGGNRQPF